MTSSAGGAGSTQIVKCCTVCILYRGGPVATNRQALQRVPVRDLKDYLAFLGVSTVTYGWSDVPPENLRLVGCCFVACHVTITIVQTIPDCF